MGEGSGLSPNHTGSLAHLVYPKSHLGAGSGLSPGHTGSSGLSQIPSRNGSGLSPGHTGTSALSQIPSRNGVRIVPKLLWQPGTSSLSQISPGRGWNGIPVGTEPPCRLQGWGQSLNEHFRHYGNSLLTPAILTRARTLFFFFRFFLVLFPFNLPTDLSFSLSPLSSLSFNKAGREITIPEAETTRICEAFSSLLILQIPPQTLQHPGTNTRKRFWTLNIHSSKKNPEYPIPGSAQGRVGQSLGWVLKPNPKLSLKSPKIPSCGSEHARAASIPWKNAWIGAHPPPGNTFSSFPL